ncbi:phage major tail tube protein [Methylobacterium sp. SyP6R]|uniref:phage major tail tube protein n=1 Tax=Methylobacterium sp. SyP6R TaxID=2718876 RepID=UPI001F47C78A|nr:phage major tail tube protein [Methylobacterium sp. SyP6R]MCF4125052.1 phage major tail tube protein [Methylobacterium sp. SyP6R]
MDNVVRGGNWYFDVINTWRVLDEVELPEIAHAEDDFTPGGHMMAVKWQEEVKALEAKIKLKTADPEVQGMVGRLPGNYITATYYENLLSFRTGANRGRVITLKGLILVSKQAAVKGHKAAGREYTFSDIVYYQDIVDGRAIHRLDFFAGPGATLINGVNPYQQMATNLAISGGTML